MKNSPLGRMLAIIAGVVMLGVSAFAIYSGHVSSFGRYARHHTIYRAVDPDQFRFDVVLYAVIGAFCIYNSI